jgi:hypothetical protein
LIVRVTLLKWLAAGCFLTAIAVEIGGSIYVHQHDARLQSEIALERAHAADYRRPVIFGDGLAQNAADWYRRAFATISKPDRETLLALNSAAAVGPAGDFATRQTLLNGPCRQVDASALRDALRCIHCDWKLPYDAIEPATAFSTRSLLAAECMVLEGDRFATAGDSQAAVRSYLQPIAMACDFGMGGLLLNAEADMIAETSLRAMARLVGRTPAATLLDSLSRQLAEFERDLPTADAAIQFERLQLLTVVSKVERTKSWGLAAWRLGHDERTLNDIVRIDRVDGGPEGWQLHERIKQRIAAAGSPMVRTSNADQWISFKMSAEIVRQSYGAVQIAIALEKLRISAGDYPNDAAAFQTALNAYGLTYRRTKDGYQLTGARNRDAQAVILEQPMRQVRG